MKLLLIRHLWGVTGNREELFPQFRELGFGGIEAALPAPSERRPLRRQMGESMKALKDAADGDAAALPQVDANVAKVLDGRAQMAAMDKELFATLSQGLAPQKRAKLALVLGRLQHEMKGFKKGRR